MIDQCSQTISAWLHNLAGDHVAVDDHPAALSESRRHRRLSRADAPGQADAQHGANLRAGGQSDAVVS